MIRILSNQAIDQVQEVVRRVLGDQLKAMGTPRPATKQGCMIYIGKTDGAGVTALSGTTPGTGTVVLQDFDSSGDLTARQDADSNDVEVTVYSFSAVPPTTCVMLAQEMLTGKIWVVNPNIKTRVRFTLDSALGTSDSSKAATVDTQHGAGVNGATAITVTNLETSSAGVYVFSGDSGDAGWADWDTGTTYTITNMECP